VPEHPYEVPGVSTRPIIDETRTTSRGSPKRPIPGADNHTDRPRDPRGPASTDKPHEITTALRAPPRSALPNRAVFPELGQISAHYAGETDEEPGRELSPARAPTRRRKAMPLIHGPVTTTACFRQRIATIRSGCGVTGSADACAWSRDLLPRVHRPRTRSPKSRGRSARSATRSANAGLDAVPRRR